MIADWIDRARGLAQSTLVREIGITYTGQVFASGLGFLLQLFLQKQLGPADYGILGLASSVGSLAGVATDLGISHAMVRFGSKYLAEQPARAMARFAAALIVRLLLVAVVMAVGFATAYAVAVGVFDKPELVRPLQFTYLGMIGTTLFGFWTFFIQTHQRFLTRSLVTVATALLRVGLMLGIFLASALSPSSVILADAGASFLGFLLGMVFSPRGLLGAERREIRAAFTEIVPYCRFTGVMFAGDVVFNELDILMLGAMAERHVVGVYRAAWTYAMVVGFLNLSVANVMFPKVTALDDPAALRETIRKTFKLTIGLGLLTLPVLPAVALWIPYYEPQYSAATTIFFIMYAGILVDLIFNPVSYVLYSLERPDVLTWVALAKIAVNFAGNLLLIPGFGAHGAAAATVITRILGAWFTMYAIERTFRVNERRRAGG